MNREEATDHVEDNIIELSETLIREDNRAWEVFKKWLLKQPDFPGLCVKFVVENDSFKEQLIREHTSGY